MNDEDGADAPSDADIVERRQVLGRLLHSILDDTGLLMSEVARRWPISADTIKLIRQGRYVGRRMYEQIEPALPVPTGTVWLILEGRIGEAAEQPGLPDVLATQLRMEARLAAERETMMGLDPRLRERVPPEPVKPELRPTRPARDPGEVTREMEVMAARHELTMARRIVVGRFVRRAISDAAITTTQASQAGRMSTATLYRLISTGRARLETYTKAEAGLGLPIGLLADIVDHGPGIAAERPGLSPSLRFWLQQAATTQG